MGMNSRIALYGVSRSGKDYNIRDALEIAGGVLRHVSPISMVHRELNGRKLKGMPAEEKAALMSRVRERISEERGRGDIITDEHYCFPSLYGGKRISNGYVDEKLPTRIERDSVSGRDYEVVMDINDASTMTAAVYLKAPAEVILERFRISEGCKLNTDITLDDIRCWQDFEIRSLRSFFRENEIPFTVLEGTDVGEELAGLLTERGIWMNGPPNPDTCTSRQMMPALRCAQLILGRKIRSEDSLR